MHKIIKSLKWRPNRDNCQTRRWPMIRDFMIDSRWSPSRFWIATVVGAKTFHLIRQMAAFSRARFRLLQKTVSTFLDVTLEFLHQHRFGLLALRLHGQVLVHQPQQPSLSSPTRPRWGGFELQSGACFLSPKMASRRTADSCMKLLVHPPLAARHYTMNSVSMSPFHTPLVNSRFSVSPQIPSTNKEIPFGPRPD